MTDGGQLYLDPQRAISAGKDLAAAGMNLATERFSSGRDLTALSLKKPWGNDDIGAAFEKQYRPMEEKVIQAWIQIAEYITSIGNGAVQSVHENMNADAEAGTRVIKTYKDV